MTTNKVPDEVSAPVRPVALVVDDVHVQYDAYLAGSNDRSLKRFVTGQRTRATINALSGISFTLRQGDSLGVLGHNGSGKSTSRSDGRPSAVHKRQSIGAFSTEDA